MTLPLWPHQAHEIELASTPKRAFYWDPRTGKSRGAIEALLEAWAPVGGRPSRVLIAAPLIVCQIQWQDVLAQYGFTVIPAWNMTCKGIEFELARKGFRGVLLINYDKMFTLREKIKRWKPEALIADESHLLSNPTSNRGKAVRAIAERTPWVRILSGTPIPNHLGNFWSQMACLDDPSKSNWGTWKNFREKFLILDPYYPSKVIGYQNEAELWEKVRAFSSFVRREDVFGKDQWQHVRREVTMPEDARVKYERLVRDWMLESEDPVGEVRADHRLKRITRLRQLCTGHLPDETGVVHQIHDAKIAAVEADLIDVVASGEKALVFHQFTWESDAHFEHLRKRFSEVLVRRINGDTPKGGRATIIEEFQRYPGPAILVAQTQTIGIGIPLHFVDHVMFASQGWSYVEEEQARDRVFAPGKARCVTHYVVADTCEEYIEEVVVGKQSMHEAVLSADKATLAFGRRYHQTRRSA